MTPRSVRWSAALGLCAVFLAAPAEAQEMAGSIVSGRLESRVVPGKGGAPELDREVIVRVPADAPLAEYRFSERGGTVSSAIMLEERYTRPARPPMAGVPEERLAGGPIDLVTTWSPAYLPYRLLFNELTGAGDAELLIRRDGGGVVRDGRVAAPSRDPGLQVDRPVRVGDELTITAPTELAGTYTVKQVTASGAVVPEPALPTDAADGLAYEVRRKGPLATLWEADATFTRIDADPALPLTFVWPDPKTDRSSLWIEKRFTGGAHAHELKLTVVLHNVGEEAVKVHPGLRVAGWQHEALASGASIFEFPTDLYSASCFTGGDLETIDFPTLIEEPAAFSTETLWVGVDTRYFLLAAAADNMQGAQCRLEAVPPPMGVISATLWAPSLQTIKGGQEGCVPAWLSAAAGQPACEEVLKLLGHEPGTPVKTIRAAWQSRREELSGAEREALDAAYNAFTGRRRAVYRFTLYAGPKDQHMMEATGHELSASLNFGMLGFISLPMLKLLRWFQGLTGHWVWAIILLTILVKGLLLPLTNKSFTQMQRMAKLRPDIEKIQKEYKDDREALGRAQMALFKRERVNPLGGCLPMVVQMPIWFALYRTILSSVELYNAPLGLWIRDLSSPDPWYVLPVVLGGLMLVQSFFTPTTTGTDGAQAKFLKYGMPLMFSVFMVALPSGLVLYILVNTVLTIIQNIVIRRRMA